MSKISRESKKFGCSKSYNIYYPKFESPDILVNPLTYKFRAAGGHLHFGHENEKFLKDTFKDVETLIKVMDILVGNTCVLLDDNDHEGLVERRKNYGRAGEFRTPKHGVEYRVLSNFWMKSYPLFSLVFSLGRLSIDMVSTRHIYDSNNSLRYVNLAKKLLSLVDQDDIIKAINEDDKVLALANFKKIMPFFEDTSIFKTGDYSMSPINKDTIPCLLHLANVGIAKYNSKNCLSYWVKGYREPYDLRTIRRGWETFCSGILSREIAKEKRANSIKRTKTLTELRKKVGVKK